jgi:hypothetical protein
MNEIEKLGFNNWFQDKVDLSKTNFNIVRVISVNKNSFVVSNGVWGTSRSYRDVSGNFCHGATVATQKKMQSSKS